MYRGNVNKIQHINKKKLIPTFKISKIIIVQMFWVVEDENSVAYTTLEKSDKRRGTNMFVTCLFGQIEAMCFVSGEVQLVTPC